jgi:membrane protein
MRLTPRNVFWLLRRSLYSTLDDNCLGYAKAAAYSALLSFFPVLASVATILLETRAGFFSNMLERSLSEIVPPGTEDLVLQQFRVSGSRPVMVLIVAAVVSIFAASGVIKSLVEGFHAAYHTPRNRSILHGSVVAMGLVVISILPLIAASFLIFFGRQIENAVMGWLQVDPELNPYAWIWVLLSRIAQDMVAFGTTVVLTATLYFFGPYRQQRWKYIWPGAILATILWLAATSGFAWYVLHIGHYNVMYGSVSASIALLVWMYLLAIICLIGCEFNAEYERASMR